MNASLSRTGPAALALALVFSAPLFAASSSSAWRSTPFAQRSGSGEKMQFTAIPASDSGLNVENPYDDPAMWDQKYAEFQGGSIGTGIAVGDVDGDGLVDIYVANKTRPNQLFRQVAPFKFVDITAEAGVAGPAAANGVGWKTGVTMADVNNDGFLDLYVCRFNAPNLLYLNDGHGHFREAAHEVGLDVVSGSVVGAFEDYDRDGKLDLFLLTNVLDVTRAPDGEPDYLFHNRGDGTFEDVSTKAGITRDAGRGHSATWFDANGDGWPDLYIANDFAVPDHLYRNNGDGTFTDALATMVPHTTWFSMGSDSADINNDGQFDLLVAEMAGTTHFKSKVAMGDMGGLVNYMDTLVTPQYMKNAVFLNTGADRFMEVAKLTGLGSSDWSWSARFEDLDNDGWVDLHITNGMVRPFIDSDLLNTIKKLQTKQETIALVKSKPPQVETHLAFRNDHDLHFTKVQKEWGLDHTAVSFGSAFADFDNDGDLDLVYVNYEGTVSLYRNDCPGNHSLEMQLQGTVSNKFGIGAQVIARTEQGTQIRKLTVARGALSSSPAAIHFGLGSSAQVSELEVRWPSGQVQKFSNLAADARYTITEPARKAKIPGARASRPVDHGLFADEAAKVGINFVNKERVFDDMKRQSLLPNRMNTLGGGVAWGDVNADGAPDLFVAGAAGNPSELFLNDGKGHFAPSTYAQPWKTNVEMEVMSAVFVDANRDGSLDLVLIAGGVESDKGSANYRSHLYLNDDQGGFTEVAAPHFPAPLGSSSVVAAGDFDHDGDLDLFIGGRVVPGEYPTAPESALLENRNGTFVDVTDTVCPALRRAGMVTCALWTDVDEDGWPDLLIAGEWMSPRLFHNTGQGSLVETTAEAKLDGLTGWWNSMIAADVNDDGHVDYVLGNVGLNTKYHATTERPVQLFYGDFEGTGKYEIVEGEYEGDKLYPVRGRSCSSRAMPSLKEKFPTFRAFGAALLPEIYAPDKLDRSLHLAANELSSGVLINDGQGHFAFRALPRIAQASPVFGMAAADFDGDGHVDLVLGQNFAGPQVETGRFDGGISLLLRGDGQGDFTPVPAQASGVAIPGEVRGMALADWNRDGWPELALTRVNEPMMALVRRGDGRSTAIKLTDALGNAQAIGARVVVTYRDGSKRASELYAGSGYLSQSEPLVFVGYAANNEPKSVAVTWPDGSKTTHPFRSGVTRILLQKNR